MAEPVITDHFTIRKDEKRISHLEKKCHKNVQDQGTKEQRKKNDDEANLNLLREFDLNCEYGPCTGITRLERWNRAEKYGRAPSQTVRQLLLKYPNDRRYTESVWVGYEI